ncbi:hypothetical protein LHK_00930 [Laribacter hongkongensis HLHK9]|uniref:Uncharacterized protein n=1 Tax=Laribacter hongkongensis (strain HLHK9) TaxID=557598 RepID=C1D5A5_LARHH|nr:hypothetical protein LHK_00930 [Laribacter hongkongensis HLHK9]
MLSLQLDRLYIQHSCSLFEIFHRHQHGNTQTLNRYFFSRKYIINQKRHQKISCNMLDAIINPKTDASH